jgi:hypothetical protein
VAISFDRRFIKELAAGLLIVQLVFIGIRIWEGTFSFQFDVLNTTAKGRLASESFVCFPLSMVALYFGMTRQFRWCFLCFVGVLSGLRRGPVLADLAGFLAFHLTTWVGVKRQSIISAACALLFGAGALTSIYAPELLSEWQSAIGRTLSINQITNGRFEMYVILQRQIFESTRTFLLGHGPGFSSDYLYFLGLGAEPWDHPHNDFIAILLDLGILGLCLIIVSWLILIGRTRFSIAIACYMTVLWLVDNTFVYYFHLIVVLFVIWALRQERYKALVSRKSTTSLGQNPLWRVRPL